MGNRPQIKLYSLMIDCREPYALAKFYAALLGWEIPFHNDEYACACPPGVQQGAYPGISFQKNPEYVPPMWPQQPGAQQQMAHLDFAVDDLPAAVEHAIACGAAVADQQFSDGWTVLFDPAGHPFCLVAMEPIFQSPHFALR